MNLSEDNLGKEERFSQKKKEVEQARKWISARERGKLDENLRSIIAVGI